MSSREPLVNLLEKSKPTGAQNALNYIGFGAVSNAAISVAIAKSVKKLFPNFCDKWAGYYEKKYIIKKEKEFIKPFESTIDDKAKEQIRQKIAVEAKAYGHKTVDGRLLTTGGFVVLPFQAALSIYIFSKNVLTRTRKYSETYSPEALAGELRKQETLANNGSKADQKKYKKLSDAVKQDEATKQETGEYKKRKFSPFAAISDDKRELGIWAVGRVFALGAAFTTQKFIDDRLGTQKDKLDIYLARFFTRMIRGKDYRAPDNHNPFIHSTSNDEVFVPHPDDTTVDNIVKTPQSVGAIMAEEKIDDPYNNAHLPKDIDPKIYHLVRLFTTESYLTTVAILTQKFTVENWDKRSPQIKENFDKLKDKLNFSTSRSS